MLLFLFIQDTELCFELLKTFFKLSLKKYILHKLITLSPNPKTYNRVLQKDTFFVSIKHLLRHVSPLQSTLTTSLSTIYLFPSLLSRTSPDISLCMHPSF